MKKNYLSLLLVFGGFAFCHAQTDMDFEPAGTGAAYTWNVFENDTNPPLEFVANPSATGINTSGTVVKFTSLITGNPWAGCETSHDNGMADFVLDAAHSTIKIMVYKSVISDVAIKLVTPTSAALPELKVANTKINEWEELTFDFSAQIGWFTEPFDQIVVFPDFSPIPRTYGTVSYFDNIVFGESEIPVNPTGPMTAAPDPDWAAADVISMFCGVYTDVAVDTWHTDWSDAAFVEVEIEGNATKKYSNLNYVGVETVGSQIDATAMDHFSVCVWSGDFTTLRIKLVDFGANGVYDGPGMADDKEHELTFDAPAQNTWITYDIPLSDFTGLTTRANIAQLIFASNGTATVYVDNVYFRKTPTAGTNEFASAKARLYPNPATDGLMIESPSIISDVTVYNMLGQQVLKTQPNTTAAILNIGQLTAGAYMVNTTGNGVVTSQKIIKK